MSGSREDRKTPTARPNVKPLYACEIC